MIMGHDFSDLRRKDKIIYHGVNEIFFNNNKKCAKIGDLIIKHIAIANLLMTKLEKYKNENFYYNNTLLVKKVYQEELEDFIKIKYNFWVGWLLNATKYLTH